jgi:small subunit ribosomal protein S21
MKVEVRNNNVEKALRILKKKQKRDGFFQLLKSKEFYLKPSAKKREERKKNISNWKRTKKLREQLR